MCDKTIVLSRQLIKMIDEGDLFGMVFLVAILIFVAQRVSHYYPKVQKWSRGIGLFVFLLYLARDVVKYGFEAPASLIAAALRGGLASGLAIGAAGIFLPSVMFLYNLTIGYLRRQMASARRERRRRADSLQSAERQEFRQLEQKRQQDAEAENRHRQFEDKRQREQRERDDAKRRDDARFGLQMHYDRLATSLRDQFSPARLQEYFDRYMDDCSSADEVEDRAAKLRDMLDELSVGGTGRSHNGATLESVRGEFQTRRQEIQSAGFDEKTAAAMLASLAREEERAIREAGQS